MLVGLMSTRDQWPDQVYHATLMHYQRALGLLVGSSNPPSHLGLYVQLRSFSDDLEGSMALTSLG